MANTIKHKRASGSDPSASDLVVGELAIRTDTGVVFTKKDDNSVAEIAGGGASAINDLSDAKTANSDAALGLGTGALAADDGGNSTIAIGKDALNDQTSGNFNCAIGVEALSLVTTTGQNMAFGVYAGRRTTGSSNVFVGYSAGEGVSGSATGSNNLALGEKCMENYTSTSNNVAIGTRALRNATSGGDNVTIGYYSGDAITTGTNNVSIGHDAAGTLTTGSNNIAIGHNTQPSSNTVSNEITLGDSSITNLRIPGLSVVAQAESFAIGGAIYENAQSISADYSITSGNNAMSAGPITVDSGVTVTVTSGCTWTVV